MDIKKKRKERILMSFVNTMTNLFEIESYYVDELIDFDYVSQRGRSIKSMRIYISVKRSIFYPSFNLSML